MRRILVNHALAHRAAKRDAELVPVTLSGLDALGAPPDRDLVAVHEALLAFEAVDPRAAKVVELRFFGGLENEEIAQALGLSLATVKRDWTLARAWLRSMGSTWRRRCATWAATPICWPGCWRASWPAIARACRRLWRQASPTRCLPGGRHERPRGQAGRPRQAVCAASW